MKRLIGPIIIISLVVAAVCGGTIAYSNFHSNQVKAGAFSPTGGGTYLLQSSISSTQSTITLTSFTEPGSGIPYTMAYIGSDIIYGTISPTSGNSEFVSASGITQNANGTATLTGVVRGESRTPGTGGCVASSTLAHAYPGQTQFILSNTPCFYSEYAARRTAQTISGLWTFTTPPVGINPGGSPNASITVNGLVQLATARQAASSTVNGSSGAADVLQSAYATDTPQNCSTAANGGCVVMSLLNGKLSQLWLDLTQTFSVSGLWTFTKGITSTATTTLAGSSVTGNAVIINGVPYAFPGSQGSAGTVLADNGSGVLSWSTNGTVSALYNNPAVNVGTSNNSTTTLLTVAIPANTLNASNASLLITAHWSEPTFGTCFGQIDYGNGTATTTIAYTGTAGNTAYWQLNDAFYATSSAAEISSYSSINQKNPSALNGGIIFLPAYSFSVINYIDFRGICSANGPINLLLASVQLTN